MPRSLRHRIRWGNVTRLVAALAVVALVLAWPRLGPPEPQLPPATVVPLSDPEETLPPRRPRPRRPERPRRVARERPRPAKRPRRAVRERPRPVAKRPRRVAPSRPRLRTVPPPKPNPPPKPRPAEREFVFG
jgi:protein TonB